MKREKMKYVLITVTLLVAFFSWFSVYRAITVAESSTWLVPMLGFSFFAVSLFLSAVLIREAMVLEFLIVASFAFSIFFAFNLWHIVIVGLCILLAISAVMRIRKDLDLNVKVSLWKSFNMGKTKWIFALAFVISSQYFFIVKNIEGQKNIPELDLSAFSQKLVVPILGIMNPNFKEIQKDDLTVDQFILKSQENAKSDLLGDEFIDSQIPQDLPSDQRDILKKEALKNISDMQRQVSEKNNEFVLREGRRQLSEMVGRQIDGSEKIVDVFSGLINKKMNDYFNSQMAEGDQSSVFPLILAIVLFLTIVPVGSLLGNLWFGIAIFIFNTLVRSGIVEIRKVQVEREMIA